MKILNIIRHAKSIQNSSIKNDIYRTITKIGKIDADFLNRYLVQYNFNKHKILCSTSLRTKQTLECFKYSLNNEPSPESEGSLQLCFLIFTHCKIKGLK